MGYSIQYAQDLNKAFKRRKPFRLNKKMIGIASGVLVLLSVFLSSKVRSAVWEFCIPGEADVTMSAFSEMMHEIRGGQPISQAFGTFCKEILLNG